MSITNVIKGKVIDNKIGDIKSDCLTKIIYLWLLIVYQHMPFSLVIKNTFRETFTKVHTENMSYKFNNSAAVVDTETSRMLISTRICIPY